MPSTTPSPSRASLRPNCWRTSRTSISCRSGQSFRGEFHPECAFAHAGFLVDQITLFIAESVPTSAEREVIGDAAVPDAAHLWAHHGDFHLYWAPIRLDEGLTPVDPQRRANCRWRR